jgi:hypothetical protein
VRDRSRQESSRVNTVTKKTDLLSLTPSCPPRGSTCWPLGRSHPPKIVRATQHAAPPRPAPHHTATHRDLQRSEQPVQRKLAVRVAHVHVRPRGKQRGNQRRDRGQVAHYPASAVCGEGNKGRANTRADWGWREGWGEGEEKEPRALQDMVYRMRNTDGSIGIIKCTCRQTGALLSKAARLSAAPARSSARRQSSHAAAAAQPPRAHKTRSAARCCRCQPSRERGARARHQ